MSGVQAPTLFRSKYRSVWEGQRVVVSKGPLKGYHGLVKAEYEGGVDVELDARLASSGQTRQRFSIENVFIECLSECVMQYLFIYAWTNPFHRHTSMPAMTVESSNRLTRTPSPKVMTRSLTPEREEPEESVPWSTTPRPGEPLGECLEFHDVFIPGKPGNTGFSQKNSKTHSGMSVFHSTFGVFLHRPFMLS